MYDFNNKYIYIYLLKFYRYYIYIIFIKIIYKNIYIFIKIITIEN